MGEFSGFEAKDLLLETQKAVGGTAMVDQFKELVEGEKNLNQRDLQVQSKTGRIAELRQQNEVLERDKQKMEERAAHLEKAEVCKKKKLWLEFGEKRDKVVAVKEQAKAAGERLRASQAELQPLKDELRESNAAATKADKRYEKERKEVDKKKRASKQLAQSGELGSGSSAADPRSR